MGKWAKGAVGQSCVGMNMIPRQVFIITRGEQNSGVGVSDKQV